MTDRPCALITPYGMRWLPEESTAVIDIERVATIKGRAILGVTVGDHRLQIAVSPKGQSVRVYFDDTEMTYVREDDR